MTVPLTDFLPIEQEYHHRFPVGTRVRWRRRPPGRYGAGLRFDWAPDEGIGTVEMIYNPQGELCWRIKPETSVYTQHAVEAFPIFPAFGDVLEEA